MCYSWCMNETLTELIPKGRVVQKLFFVNSLIMIVGLPIFSSNLGFPILIPILGIVVVAIFAGLTGSKNRLMMSLDILVSIVGGVVFEFASIASYSTTGLSAYFLFNQFVAIVFLVALYFSIRSIKHLLFK